MRPPLSRARPSHWLLSNASVGASTEAARISPMHREPKKARDFLPGFLVLAQIHGSRTGASCPGLPAHRRIEGPYPSPARIAQARARHGPALGAGGVDAPCARRKPPRLREASPTDPRTATPTVRARGY